MLLLSISFIVASARADGPPGSTPTPAGDPLARPGADGFRHNGVTAHRGDQAEAPENTLKAFADAIAAGADWVELDVYTTRDGQVVVSHDASTGRVADRDVKINDVTYDELRHVDVAASFRRRTGKTLEACPRTPPPLLTEALALIKRSPHVRLSIQPKDGSTPRAVELVKEAGVVGQVSFNDGVLAKMIKVKELEPRLRVHWDRPAKLNLDADLATAAQHKFEAIVVEQKGVTQDVVRRVKAAGFEMGAWTVNDPATARRFLDWGVDRIYTDFPRVILDLKRQRPASPPSENAPAR
jgi:glycerophosphoryl diester phosphodiesterase